MYELYTRDVYTGATQYAGITSSEEEAYIWTFNAAHVCKEVKSTIEEKVCVVILPLFTIALILLRLV